MKFYTSIVILICCLFISCKKDYQPRDFKSINIEEIRVASTSSIRAIDVLLDSTLIFATSDGKVGMLHQFADEPLLIQTYYDTITPHFRAISKNNEAVFALSIGNPALLYKYVDGEAQLVYKEEHELVFYDSMRFFDENNGIAMGDPTDGCLSIILTNDGGNTWTKIPCTELPKIEAGEAAFAASNTNIAIIESNVWIVTGGTKARVFHSPDKGKSWNVYPTPIVQGNKMTGIYSVDFFGSMNGIIFGGDWDQKDSKTGNKAITKDGGKTWQLVADGKEPGYKSCVQYVPNTKGKELFAVGSTGVSFSNDGGMSWTEISSEKDFYTIKFVNKHMAWLAGKNKIGKLILN